MKILSLLVGLLLASAPLAQAQPLAVDHVEPPHWWVGMQEGRLQLMLHGPGLAAAQVTLKHAGVRLEGTTRAASPNYLFINLRVKPDAAAGTVAITLSLEGRSRQLAYELRARAPGSAQRRGFSSADVVLNLMPDRFANGNPANDQLPGFADKLDRGQVGTRHGGDIQGIIDRLDYIAGMGFTAIWPTPMTEANEPAFSYHGYGATDTYRVDPRYGTNDDYRRLSKLARAKGICLIQDVVPNHISSSHWWMKDLPAPDWLGFDNQPMVTNHAKTTPMDPYAAQIDKRAYTSGWFVGTLPDMNQGNPLLATYQSQNVIWWIEEMDLCGLRVDTYAYSEAPLINASTGSILAEYPHFNIVGEEWNENPAVQSYWAHGRTQSDGFASALPSVMDYTLHGALRQSLVEPETFNTGLVRLYATLVSDRLYGDPGNLMLFDGNHDTPRLFSALDDDPVLTRMALAYILTIKRVPQLYYGTELLMGSPKRFNAFDDFRADFPGGWAGDAVDAVSGRGLTREQAGMQAWLRKLLLWRKTQPVIHQGGLTHFVPEDGTYVYFRHDAKRNRVMVVLNKSAVERTLKTERFREVLPASASGVEVISGRRITLGDTLRVPARSVMILQLDPQ
ncbi:glycoside hydrolase family 13 protein [soil metagenome]